MRLRKSVQRLVESGTVDFMTLMRKAVKRARLNESMGGDEDVDTTEGLDELDNADEEGVGPEEDFDDEDLDEVGDRETVTVTIPVDATLEEVMEAIDAAKAGDADEALDAEAEVAADEAADDAEAEAAADEALEDEDFDEVEEDEEAFASTRAEGPVRKIASTTYKNQMTVDSNISPTVSMGKPAIISDGSPKRQHSSGTYNNSLTVKSKIQKGTRVFQ